jgi:hypothetical protein
VNLGLVATVEKNGNRVYNDKDKFSKFYTSTYNSIIYGQGNIGDIKIYNDPYIQGDVFAVYTADFQEFIFNLDRPMIKDKGIDFYIGFILKSTEEQYDERVRLEELKKVEEKPLGDASKIFANPGNVNYEDLKAYLEAKNKNRI